MQLHQTEATRAQTTTIRRLFRARFGGPGLSDWLRTHYGLANANRLTASQAVEIIGILAATASTGPTVALAPVVARLTGMVATLTAEPPVAETIGACGYRCGQRDAYQAVLDWLHIAAGDPVFGPPRPETTD